MTKARREFTPEFKREAVALLESSGRPQVQIAAELGMPAVDAQELTRRAQWGGPFRAVGLGVRAGCFARVG